MKRRAWRRQPWALLPAALALALVAGTGAAQTQPKPYPELTPDLDPLRSQFNADAGKVRLILLLDPT
ncbi:MAG: hypothetical protein ACE5HB_00195 [Terriglobia bacterium]